MIIRSRLVGANFMVFALFFMCFALAFARSLHDQGWLFEHSSCVPNKIFARDPAEKNHMIFELKDLWDTDKVVVRDTWFELQKQISFSHVDFRSIIRMFGAIDRVPHEWQIFLADCSSSLAFFAAYDCMAWVDNSGRPWICGDDESID